MHRNYRHLKATGWRNNSILLVVFLFCIAGNAVALEDVYHSPDEIIAELNQLQRDFPDWVRLDSIGHSARSHMPIWMAKLSDNPGRIEPEPALLYIGQVHGEEVIGVEITLTLMRLLLENLDDDAYRSRLESLELYFIPTANPEGLQVVHDGLDETFRKNCRDNIGDGEFRYYEGSGWDTSGVDINRNFGLHWDRGDTLFEPDHDPRYNYYRGAAPFSEPETRALARLALDRRFLFSINYHSSRSGINEEMVIAPWSWDTKFPPDSAAIDAVLNALAIRIMREDEGGFYDPVHSLHRNGQSLDWFYQAAGTFQYLIEVGTEIQPDSARMQAVVNSNLEAAFHLMDLANGAAELPGYGYLTVLTLDEFNDESVEAVVSIHEMDYVILEPRKTVAANGRLDWLLPAGSYDVSITARSYGTLLFENVEIVEAERAYIQADLRRSDHADVVFRTIDSRDGEAVPAKISLSDTDRNEYTESVNAPGWEVELPLGFYSVEVLAEGFLPLITELFIDEDREISFRLQPSKVVFDEQFDEFGGWQRGGAGQNWGIVHVDGRSALTESMDGDYYADSDTWLLIQTEIDNDTLHNSVLRLIHSPYFEPGVDFGEVRIWNRDMRQWIAIAEFSRFPDGWDTTYIKLDDNNMGEIWVRFFVSTDGWLNEDGWLIDRLSILQSDRISEMEDVALLPESAQMSVFPNPANSGFKLLLNLPAADSGRLALYDGNGRFVRMIHNGGFSRGRNIFSIDSPGLPSGAYFVRLESGSLSRIHRLTFMK